MLGHRADAPNEAGRDDEVAVLDDARQVPDLEVELPSDEAIERPQSPAAERSGVAPAGSPDRLEGATKAPGPCGVVRRRAEEGVMSRSPEAHRQREHRLHVAPAAAGNDCDAHRRLCLLRQPSPPTSPHDPRSSPMLVARSLAGPASVQAGEGRNWPGAQDGQLARPEGVERAGTTTPGTGAQGLDNAVVRYIVTRYIVCGRWIRAALLNGT